ncbi:hypothetical protein GUITHDRAFT_116953 [Guillardia theta CCMP2712]|uniref:RZ-type domain-containing protein n=1 Tax=Guillardia theta (strain CCMP2712) TaxID=905079 RepID=L1IMB2_GUITC|nr:hypothetical protein GUITHDRAFT_116953 [Guillardia theta CCMP2712]EKX36930.1 hypothetical protein GUITHDRAFT_116953 [Guillardia theta CCMP2712]|eukprot:XP_005823910.1 hypothetical protein GUITHDRAFT_116953 [Guillardia theta CCMP2712]
MRSAPLKSVNEARIFVEEISQVKEENWCLGLLTDGGGRLRLEEIFQSEHVVWSANRTMPLEQACTMKEVLLPLMKCCQHLITNFPHLNRQIHVLMTIFNYNAQFVDSLLNLIADERENIPSRLDVEELHAVCFFAVKFLRILPQKETHERYLGLLHNLEQRLAQLTANSRKHDAWLTLDALKALIDKQAPVEVPKPRARKQTSASPLIFLPYSGPGELNETGRRHDNDQVDIADINIIPTPNELLAEQPPCLPQNKATAPHHLAPDSIQRLLDVHFRLFRHDSIANLADLMQNLSRRKSAVVDWFNKKSGSDKHRMDVEGSSNFHSFFVFRNVRFLDYAFNNIAGVVHRYEMDQIVSLKNAKKAMMEQEWKAGKIQALQKDDVVLLVRVNKLAEEDFSRCFGLATVTSITPKHKENAQCNRIEVELKLEPLEGYDVEDFKRLHEVYGIIDPRCGFYSFKSILQTLQATEYESISPVLAQLALSTENLIPVFPKNLESVVWNFECLLKPDLDWQLRQEVLPLLRAVTAEHLRDDTLRALLIERLQGVSYLDAEQTSALVQTLTRSLAITQGPPGKTFLGIAIVKLLLANGVIGPGSPLLCVCYTNHALDQFLEHLLDEFPGLQLVRLGTRTRSERLTEYSLDSFRETISRSQRSKPLRFQFGRLRAEEEECEDEIERLDELINIRKLSWEALGDYVEIEFPSIFDGLVEAANWIRESDFELNTKKDILQLWLNPLRRVKIKKGKGKKNKQAAFSNTYACLGNDNEKQPQDPAEDAQKTNGGPTAESDREEAMMLRYFYLPENPVELQVDQDQELPEIGDIWALSLHSRNQIVQMILRHFKESQTEIRLSLYERLADIHEQRRQLLRAQQVSFLKQHCSVVGCTVTGMSMFRDLINGLQSQVVLIEEAAEILEAQTLSLIGSSIQHAIFIGDHKQLRPKVNCYDLTVQSKSGYDIDRSLFERLVEDRDTPTSVLRRQYRMRPEISDLIRQTIYPELLDGDRVLQYPQVSGVVSPVFFWSHSVPEDKFQDKDMKYQTQEGSKTNMHEVACVIALIRYLVAQGYGTDRITVLTGYLGQSVLIKRELKKVAFAAFLGEKDREEAELLLADEDSSDEGEEGKQTATEVSSAGIRVATIDNFQGEENDIMILSLVRSNPKKVSGFMKVENRVNVLLSRAKHGMYLVGNTETITFHDRMWTKVLGLLSQRACVGDAFPIVCQKHPNDIRYCKHPQDFLRLSQDGGCMLPCEARLSCGHVCPRACHPDGHQGFQCLQPCTKRPKGCQKQHECRKLCFQDCGLCSEIITDVKLHCGHFNSIECWKTADPRKEYCSQTVTIAMPVCGHEVQVPCRLSDQYLDGELLCPVPCGGQLKCGHGCTSPCGKCLRAGCAAQDIDFMSSEYRDIVPLHAKSCNVRCEQKLSNLCGHTCRAPCHAFYGTKCGEAVCQDQCTLACQHSKCSKPCGAMCTPCMERCDWACEHVKPCSLLCFAPCDRLPCNKRCNKKLKCGHRCPSVCGEPCGPYERFCPTCDTTGKVRKLQVDLLTFSTLEEANLDEDPLILFPCKQHALQISSADAHMELHKAYVQDEKGDLVGLKEEGVATKDSFLNKLCPFGCGRTKNDGYRMRRYGRVVNARNAVLCQQKIIIQTNVLLKNFKDENLEASLSGESKARLFEEACRIHEQLNDFKNTITTNMKKKSSSSIHQRLVEPLPTVRAKSMNVLLRCAMGVEIPLKPEQVKEIQDSSFVLLQDLVELKAYSSFLSLTDSLLLYLIERRDFVSIRNFFDILGVVISSELPDNMMHKVVCQAMMCCCTLMSAGKLKLTKNLIIEVQNIVDSSAAYLRACRPGEQLEEWKQLADSFSMLLMTMKRYNEKEVNLKGLSRMLSEVRQVLIQQAKSLQTSNDPEVAKAAGRVLQKLDTGVSREDFQQIFKAIQFHPSDEGWNGGHWYACPNGHPYVIADCGGAMVTAKCYECGAIVGGEHHRLQDANRVIRSEEELLAMSRSHAGP